MNDEPPHAIPTVDLDKPEPMHYAKPPRRRAQFMKWLLRALLVVAVLIPEALGICLYLQSRESIDRQRGPAENRLIILRGQMAGLAQRLRDYRSAHGRYPTNDEGLTALDPLPGRFRVWTRGLRTVMEMPQCFPSRSDGHGWISLDDSLMKLRSVAAKGGGSFTELAKAHVLGAFREIELAPSYPDQCAFDLEIGPGNELYIIDHRGVLEPWLIPFGYENRNGVAASGFAGSPVVDDPGGDYSVCVDRDVYVYSLGAMTCMEQMRELRWAHAGAMVLPLLLCLPAVVTAAYLVRKRLWPLAVVLLAGSVGAGLVADRVRWSTCYIVMHVFSYRPPALVAKQEALLERYRDAGVITQATFDRSMEPIEHVKAAPTKVP